MYGFAFVNQTGGNQDQLYLGFGFGFGLCFGTPIGATLSLICWLGVRYGSQPNRNVRPAAAGPPAAGPAPAGEIEAYASPRVAGPAIGLMSAGALDIVLLVGSLAVMVLYLNPPGTVSRPDSAGGLSTVTMFVIYTSVVTLLRIVVVVGA